MSIFLKDLVYICGLRFIEGLIWTEMLFVTYQLSNCFISNRISFLYVKMLYNTDNNYKYYHGNSLYLLTHIPLQSDSYSIFSKPKVSPLTLKGFLIVSLCAPHYLHLESKYQVLSCHPAHTRGCGGASGLPGTGKTK